MKKIGTKALAFLLMITLIVSSCAMLTVSAAQTVETEVSTQLATTVRDSSLDNYFAYYTYADNKTWTVYEGDAYIDLGASDAQAEGCYYEVHFYGTGIEIFSNGSPLHGKAKITVDGEHEQIADLYSASRTAPKSVYSVQGLENGEHVLKAVTQTDKTGSKIVNQVAYAMVTSIQTITVGDPDLGGTVADTDTQYTKDRYAEVSKLSADTDYLTAWKNDKATGELVLYSKNSIVNNVSVTASDFRNVNGDVISADNVTTTFIKSNLAYNGGYLGYGSTTRPVPEATVANRSESSDILYQKGGTVDIPYNSLQPVWVEVAVDEDTPAGVYLGKLTVEADEIAQPLVFNYLLTVQDATLPSAETYSETFDIEFWQYPYSNAEYYGVEPFSQDHFDLLESSMLMYKSVGGNTITATMIEDAWNGQTYSKNDVHYPSMIRWNKNGDSFTFDYTNFDKWVEYCKSLGIGDKIVIYSILPWHNSFTYWDGDTLVKEAYTVNSERYKSVWTLFITDLISHLEEKGWFDQTYIGIDERGFNAEVLTLIESIKGSNGESLKTAGSMDRINTNYDLALRVTHLSVGDNAAQSHLDIFNRLVAERAEKGLDTTLYSCTEHRPGNFSLSMPVESYWSVINAAKNGAAGFSRWAYDAWVENPLEDATHNAFEPGDCFVIYPDEKDAENPESKSSVRLERMAEGVRDVIKLNYIKENAPELSGEIDNLYAAISTTASTGQTYLNASERAQVIADMQAFSAGVDEITDEYLQTLGTARLNLDAYEKVLEVGESFTISTNANYVYRSIDPSVAYVIADGKVTARNAGETAVIVYDKLSQRYAVVNVTVNEEVMYISNKLPQYKLPEQYLSDVEKGTPKTDPSFDSSNDRHYLGQPDMIGLDDNKTLITVFPVGHGVGRIIMKVSHDAGETWEEKTDIPTSWSNSYETPTIYKLNMTDGTTKLILISGRPRSFGAVEGGWDSSISTDNGETWTEYERFCETLANGNRNETVVAMASLIQLKDENGNFIDKWMGVYHDGGSFVNYKSYLTFDENGNQQWSTPEAYLAKYRSIESSHQICEVGLFRSPDGKRIVGLARNQSHNGPATMFYSDDEGDTWSEPVELPGSLAGERHKPVYDPTDPTGQRLIIPFREIIYDLNGNNTFDGGSDWLAGDWVAWVGTYDDLMNLRQGSYRILLCEDWAANAKSGDTGYTGVAVLPDGTLVMDTYGHWDKEYSQSLSPYNVREDWCWIKQAKFGLSDLDSMIVPDIKEKLQSEIEEISAQDDADKYFEETWDEYTKALENAQQILGDDEASQDECNEALDNIVKAKNGLIIKGTELLDHETATIEYTLGDVDNDGDVDSADATLALQHYAGIIVLEETQLLAGNVDGTLDGANEPEVDSTDATLILQYYAEIITKFPIE